MADIERAIRVLHDYGIKSHGMFVLGADTDDAQTVRDTVSFAIKNHIDTLMPSILTPLPGTPLFEELDAAGRIFDKRWQLYDAHHVVFEPAADDAPTNCRWRYCAAVCASTRCAPGCAPSWRFGSPGSLLWHWWGRAIIRNWRRDARNRAFMAALKRMAPRLASDETTSLGVEERPVQAPANLR